MPQWVTHTMNNLSERPHGKNMSKGTHDTTLCTNAHVTRIFPFSTQMNTSNNNTNARFGEVFKATLSVLPHGGRNVRCDSHAYHVGMLNRVVCRVVSTRAADHQLVALGRDASDRIRAESWSISCPRSPITIKPDFQISRHNLICFKNTGTKVSIEKKNGLVTWLFGYDILMSTKFCLGYFL